MSLLYLPDAPVRLAKAGGSFNAEDAAHARQFQGVRYGGSVPRGYNPAAARRGLEACQSGLMDQS